MFLCFFCEIELIPVKFLRSKQALREMHMGSLEGLLSSSLEL